MKPEGEVMATAMISQMSLSTTEVRPGRPGDDLGFQPLEAFKDDVSSTLREFFYNIQKY